MKIEEFHSSLEAHELMVIYIGVEKSIQQDIQVKVIKKNEHERNFKKERKENLRIKSWSKMANQRLMTKLNPLGEDEVLTPTNQQNKEFYKRRA